MLWTEKYRPTKLRDIIGQEHFVMDAETWLDEGEMPNLLFYGNAGLGKTGAAVALSKSILGDKFSDNFYEVNASDDRKLETVRTTIKQIAQSSTIGDVPFRICLLDEMEGMTTDAQNALKRIMERYADNIRFIITCNDRNKIIFPLQSRCANYHFKPLSNENMITVLRKILDAEKIDKFSDDDLGRFIYDLNGDMRRAITELQAAKSSGFSLKKQVESMLKVYSKSLELMLEKKMNECLEGLHNLIYEGYTVKEICLGLHNAIINSEGIESAMKFKMLRVTMAIVTGKHISFTV